jgi:antitoxin YefM
MESLMAHVNVSEFRQNLAAHLEDVSESRAPLVVTRGKGKSVVVLSEEEYDSMAETLHLIASPENARRLREAVAELDAGEGEAHPIAATED